MEQWIGVDLDGTLAYYESGYATRGIIGPPIPLMLERVKKMISDGLTVKIFTARVSQDSNIAGMIHDWLESHGLPRLDVTNIKDYGMVELWDDRAVAVEQNTGIILNCIDPTKCPKVTSDTE